MDVHLLDGTYELFRHFYAMPSARDAEGREVGAVRGVLNSVLGMINSGSRHVGVATDHVIESFRNRLWRGYKTSAGIDPNLLSQFQLLEDSLTSMGVAVWPMVELEADDGLASAAHAAAADERVEKVCIWTPDKDLAQCVQGERVVQIHRISQKILDAAAVERKYGVPPHFMADFLALVGDSADGYPGIGGIGAVGAARLVRQHGAIENFPPTVLGERREQALLFKKLATLRTDARLFGDVDELRWRGPTPAFSELVAQLGDTRLLPRALGAGGLTAA